jgi:hypothetical protein
MRCGAHVSMHACVRMRPVHTQRDVEGVAFEHRQRILREEERLRNWRQEAQHQLDAREV